MRIDGMKSALVTIRPRLLAMLVLALMVVWFCNLDYRSLVRPDEGRYAEIAREMAISGNWTTPRLNGIKYFEKPPLQYWMTAIAYKVFGENEWTARLWAALTGFAGVLMVGFAGARLFDRRAGFYAAIVLASSLIYAAIGHMNTLDMGVTFCLTLGLLGFLLAQRGEERIRETRLWMWLAWAAMGLAFLSKGLIGLALPGAAMVVYALVQRDLSFLKRIEPVAGIAILLAIALPWIVTVSVANPEFLRFFFIHEHFERFLTQVHHRTAPWWYFIPVLVAGLLPWTAMLGHAVVAGWKADAGNKTFKPRRFLLLYAMVIFLFFSTSQSKLASYILPVFPALALLIGDWLTGWRGRKLVWMILPVAGVAVALAIASLFTVKFGNPHLPPALYASFGHWILAGALILLSACVLAMMFARRERLDSALVTLGFGGLLLVQFVMTGHDSLAPSHSTAHLVGIIRPHLDADTPFYSVRYYEHTLPFYIKRTVTLVEYGDELEFGQRQQPELSIPTMREFEMRWRADHKALAIMGPDLYRELTRGGLPMRVLAEDWRRVIVSKP